MHCARRQNEGFSMVVQSVERAVSTISLGVGSLVPDPGADP